ncbi:HAAS signaling domain-containing protein [Pseudonocardia xinjiangensis]
MNEDTERMSHGAAAGGTDGGRTVRLLPGPAEEYLAGIRSALADLPAPELAEILDDVRAHLADLTAELGADASHAALVARLGSPAVYAGELRAAAGYPPAPVQAGGPGRSRSTAATLAVAGLVGSVLLVVLGLPADAPGLVLLGLLVALLGLPLLTRDGPGLPTVAEMPLVRRLVESRPAAGTPARGVADFLASLQPGWWVVRGVIAAALMLAVLAQADPPLVVLLSLVTVPVSVWLGHRTRRDRRLLWVVVPLNTLAAVLALGVLLSTGAGLLDGPRPAGTYSSQSYQPGLWQDGDRPIRDIRPVDAAGNPLTGVYLFDQDGRPIDTTDTSVCTADYRSAETAANAARPYPRGTTDYDPRTGDCVVVPPGPLLVAVPSATPQASATTTASPPPTTALAPTGSATTGTAPPSVTVPPAPPVPSTAPVPPAAPTG